MPTSPDLVNILRSLFFMVTNFILGRSVDTESRSLVTSSSPVKNGCIVTCKEDGSCSVEQESKRSYNLLRGDLLPYL